MKTILPIIASLLISIALPVTGADTTESLLQDYRKKGAGSFSAERGRSLWQKQTPQTDGSPERSCASCHGNNLKTAGNHARTGKPIKAMSPLVNPQRLIERKKIEKWFKRNCKWTWGRLCTPQEKGDLLRFISGSS